MHGLGAQAPLEVKELAVWVCILSPATLQEQGAHIRVCPCQHKHLQVVQVWQVWLRGHQQNTQDQLPGQGPLAASTLVPGAMPRFRRHLAKSSFHEEQSAYKNGQHG